MPAGLLLGKLWEKGSSPPPALAAASAPWLVAASLGPRAASLPPLLLCTSVCVSRPWPPCRRDTGTAGGATQVIQDNPHLKILILTTSAKSFFLSYEVTVTGSKIRAWTLRGRHPAARPCHGQVSPTDGARGQAEGPRGREGGWPVAWGETPASGKQQSLGKQVLFGRLAVQEAETLAGTPGAVCAYLLPWRAALC